MDQIFIFSVRFNPMIPFDNSHLRNKLLTQIIGEVKTQISNPVISGMNIYSTSEPTLPEKDYTANEYTVKVKQVKVYKIKGNPKMLLTFLNNGLKNLMRKLDYVEIGKSGKFFNTKERSNIDNLLMYNGYKANFVHLEKGYFLRVDPAKKIVRN
jgi:hypothetical protein